jgi:aspartyl-tRNA synthetase
MQRTMLLRHRMVKIMRDYCDALGFVDVETPMLGRSTPEGARDYLVPSRVQQGAYYALPQSPQLYKQILMVAGYDRYIQVARCFRDEDLRADRQPEFTQMDLEMSFVTAEDIIGVIDGLVARLAKEILGLEVTLPLPRMRYDEAMERFGHDAPDLRFGMELIDITALAKESEFQVFRGTADSGGRVRGINAKGAAARYSRKGIDELTAFIVENFGAKGLAWFKVEADGRLASPIAKNFQPDLLVRIGQTMDAAPGDLLLLVADKFETTCKALYALRKRLGAELKLYDPATMNFSWIVEFPMFAFDTEENCWTAMHHPFTGPRPQDRELLSTDPQKCRAQAYDLVINGYEAGGGTIRIHDQQLQQQVFGLLGIDEATARERFGFLLDALQYGAPPHGGIALGVDRMVMLFAGLDSIRDCIAFPKTQRATDMMTGAPGLVDAKQLRELGIKPAPAH